MKNKIIVKSYQSPAGMMRLGSIGRQICLCDWAVERRRNLINRRLCKFFQADMVDGTSRAIEMLEGELDEYFNGKRRKFSARIAMSGTDFQTLVWKELMRIPYAATRSYAEMADNIGCPKGVRAVANACATNPISILVPCHRVIGSNRKLTGYAGGLDAKRMLLSIENLSRQGILTLWP